MRDWKKKCVSVCVWRRESIQHTKRSERKVASLRRSIEEATTTTYFHRAFNSIEEKTVKKRRRRKVWREKDRFRNRREGKREVENQRNSRDSHSDCYYSSIASVFAACGSVSQFLALRIISTTYLRFRLSSFADFCGVSLQTATNTTGIGESTK